MSNFEFLHPKGWRPAKRVKATIAPYKYARAMKFIDALPKTQTGKIQRFKLREQSR
jgi:acyl-coenzyme A synthetase/AMP-(fatty) acid ligase